MAVLGLGLAALVGDRVLLSESQTGPQTATASPVSRTPGHSADPRPAQVHADSPGEAALVSGSLAAKLENVRVGQSLDPAAARDAFCASQQWLDDLTPDKPESSDEVRAQAFLRNHRLKAVVKFDRGGAAIIDDSYLFLGQELDGFRLIRVSDRTATLVSGSAKVTVSMEEDN